MQLNAIKCMQIKRIGIPGVGGLGLRGILNE
jgi:hypothetical protein